jgi:hypothetical protein
VQPHSIAETYGRFPFHPLNNSRPIRLDLYIKLWIRFGQYPGITIGSVFGGDGAGVFENIRISLSSCSAARYQIGVVIASADANDSLMQKRVFLTPMRGWANDPDAPEST